MRVRVGSKYVFQANGLDRVALKNMACDGQVVKVVNLPGAPPANTMGNCYVEDEEGNFLTIPVSNNVTRKANRNSREGEVDQSPVKHVRLSKALQDAVALAVFAKDAGIHPADAAQLIVLARRAAAADVQYANSGKDGHKAREDKAGERFEAKARKVGLTVTWPGLLPEVAKDGVDLRLPRI